MDEILSLIQRLCDLSVQTRLFHNAVGLKVMKLTQMHNLYVCLWTGGFDSRYILCLLDAALSNWRASLNLQLIVWVLQPYYCCVVLKL